jgi:adenosylcobinamide-GDP ribazoletransferase
MTGSRVLLPPPLRGVRAAFVSLTRIPVGGFPYRPADFAWAAAHAPVVGAVVGALTGAAFRALAPVGVEAAALLSVGLSLIVTGAFHEDGLADTSDALGGGHDRERVFAILKDSRIGAFGGAALVISIAARALLVARLGPCAPWALPVVGALARVGPVWLIGTIPYVTPEATSKSGDLVRGGSAPVAVASLWGALVLSLAVYFRAVSGMRAAALAVTLAVVTIASGHHYRRRAGGITGDFLGATEQLGEIFALVVLAWGAVQTR